ncbi:hypothetical protein [Saccharibacillus qingshengii]|uniref:hypothetical protein n=1 Tax=Saccharibacillus qingshengii TaxID=1763540 RepID=UPI0015544414|nr:hypothetical protein [Saccharibacillus qingshengii]
MAGRKKRFFNEEREGLAGERVMLLYIKYAYYCTAQWIIRKKSPLDSRFTDRLKQLRAAIDDSKKIRFDHGIS